MLGSSMLRELCSEEAWRKFPSGGVLVSELGLGSMKEWVSGHFFISSSTVCGEWD